MSIFGDCFILCFHVVFHTHLVSFFILTSDLSLIFKSLRLPPAMAKDIPRYILARWFTLTDFPEGNTMFCGKKNLVVKGPQNILIFCSFRERGHTAISSLGSDQT